MCAVSMIHDYMHNRVPVNQWTWDSFNQFKDIVRRLERLDKKLNQKDCFDPDKAKWMEAVEKRLTELEKK